MLTAIVLIASPLILNVATSVVKFIIGMKSTGWQRVVLALMSLVTVIGVSVNTGQPIDPKSIDDIAMVLAEAGLGFFMAHGTYDLGFKKLMSFFVKKV